MSRQCEDHGWECTGLGHERKTTLNEIGSMTKAIEADKDSTEGSTRKVRLVVELDYEFDPASYTNPIGPDGDVLNLTREEMETLTPAQMLQYDLNAIRAGALGVDDIIGGFYYDDDRIKLELVEEKGCQCGCTEPLSEVPQAHFQAPQA